MAKVDLKNATIKIKDGTSPTPNELEIKIGDGVLEYTERRTIEYELDRGVLDEVSEGDEVPVDVSIDFIWEFLRASVGDPPTVEDALKQRGEASSWVSSDADTCRPYAVDIEITVDPPCGAIQNEVILLSDFRYEELGHNIREAQVSVRGRCNVKEATVTRS